jgi:RNA polymerase sigma-70 factor (sigma-E family)
MCDHTTPAAVGLMRDPDGFTAFAHAQSRSLFGTAWLLTGDWHASEDLVQEALGRMYRYWHRIDRIENPAAYAHTVLVCEFLSQRRRRSSTERPVRDLPDAPEREPDHALRITLADALEALSKRDRAVLVLRYLEDRSVEQVAADLDRSPGAIRVQSMRALSRLRDVLGEDTTELVHP